MKLPKALTYSIWLVYHHMIISTRNGARFYPIWLIYWLYFPCIVTFFNSWKVISLWNTFKVVCSSGFEQPMFVDTMICKNFDWKGCQEVSRCCTSGESEESVTCRWWNTYVRDPRWLWNSVQTSPEVQKQGMSGSAKRTYVLEKLISTYSTFNSV